MRFAIAVALVLSVATAGYAQAIEPGAASDYFDPGAIEFVAPMSGYDLLSTTPASMRHQHGVARRKCGRSPGTAPSPAHQCSRCETLRYR